MAHVLPNQLLLKGYFIVLVGPTPGHLQLDGGEHVPLAAQHVASLGLGGVRLDCHRVEPFGVVMQFASKQDLEVSLERQPFLVTFLPAFWAPFHRHLGEEPAQAVLALLEVVLHS